MPSWVVPSDSHSVGDTGHTTDHNHVADDLTLINSALPVVSGGLTGAVQAARFVGGTTSGAPVTGTFAVGDFIVDRSGTMWLCTSAGSPGTWVALVNRSATETIAGAKTFTGLVTVEAASGSALVVSSDGTTTSDGAMSFAPAGLLGFGLYSATFGETLYFVSDVFTSTAVGYIVGLVGPHTFGILGNTVAAGNAVLVAGNGLEGTPGIGHSAFTVYDNDTVTTFASTLDDGSGNMTLGGVAHHAHGTDTSGTAAASSPSFTSGTAAQLSTTQDVMLYVAIKTAASLTVAIGSTSAASTNILPAESAALGVITLRVPKGWYVKLTGTMADLQITAVTC